MNTGPIDLARLIDARELKRSENGPYTFLAFPQDSVGPNGVPTDPEAQEYIAAVQSQGVPVGIWVDTPTDGVAYAFVGPEHIYALRDALDSLRDSGRYPEGYDNQLANRLLGVDEAS